MGSEGSASLFARRPAALVEEEALQCRHGDHPGTGRLCCCASTTEEQAAPGKQAPNKPSTGGLNPGLKPWNSGLAAVPAL